MSSETKARILPEIQIEIADFLYREAYLLDHRMYKEWLDLLSEDIVYRMPMRATVEGVGVDDVAADSAFFDESKAALTTRVNRYYTKSAWVENPATRQRHFISNIRVESGSGPDEYKVVSYFLYKRSRGSLPEIEEMLGERHDVIKRVNGDYKIASRIIIPDQSVITTMNMSMFL